MHIFKKVLFVIFTFAICFSLVSCGYKPSSYYAKKEMEGNVFVRTLVSLSDPKNSVIVKDEMNKLLIQKLAPQLAPDLNDSDYADYLQWIHFSESSAMVPYLLKIFNSIESQHGTKLVFLENYAQVEFDKVFSFLNDYLENKKYFVANRLTGADFMMGFALNSLIYKLNQAENYPHIKSYVDGLTMLASWRNAVEIENSLNLK